MTLLALKLTLAPTFVVGASMAVNRLGPRVGGLLAGLPVIAGPILLLFAITRGSEFAAQAATGTLLGLVALTAFCVSYGLLAPRAPWPISLVAGWLAFLTVAAGLLAAPANALLALAIALIALLAGLLILPRNRRPMPDVPRAAWDLPLRATSALALVVLLTTAAESLGPHLSGLLASFPIIASVLAAFTHVRQGAPATRRVMRGMLLGLFGFALFSFTVSVSIGEIGIAPAFASGLVAAFAVQTLSLVGHTREWNPRRQSRRLVSLLARAAPS
jgi:hypothetical protein